MLSGKRALRPTWITVGLGARIAGPGATVRDRPVHARAGRPAAGDRAPELLHLGKPQLLAGNSPQKFEGFVKEV